jgi:CheY-like chemotaxis protein
MGGQFGQNGGSNGFRGPDTHQPGNGGGFKRKGGFGGKQRNGSGGGGARGFVGPMDHSYRAVNGNVFDTPPSTIDPYGNGHGGGGGRGRGYQSDSQPIDYSMGRAIPIAPDAPTKIFFFIEDLFFIAKIQETARKLGVKVAFVKNDKEQIAALTDSAEDDRPGLIVFDLNNANAKPMTLIPKLKTKLKKTTSIIGFLSHLQGDLKAKAVEAGCDTVMPRAAFSQNLPNLLRRYGIEDVEEPNYNQ